MNTSIYPPAIAELVDQFRNEVLCRHEANQAKAWKIWKELHPLLTETERYSIATEWSHYNSHELETSEFGEILRRLAERYRTV